jgi:phytoene dehydrogenase-like protein
VKTLVLSQMAIPRGVAADYDGGGIEVLKMIAGDEKPELARGGSHSIAQVLQRAYVHNGGQIRAVHHVERILVNDDGRAGGVRLRDGREWQARLAVVSNCDPYSTLVEMVSEDQLPRALIERVKNIKLDEFSYFQVHLALKAPVRYALHEQPMMWR